MCITISFKSFRQFTPKMPAEFVLTSWWSFYGECNSNLSNFLTAKNKYELTIAQVFCFNTIHTAQHLPNQTLEQCAEKGIPNQTYQLTINLDTKPN